MLANERVTINDLAVVLGVSRRQVIRYVKELTEDEIIRRDGGHKLGKWVILNADRTKDSE
jgi:DNA-binding Lrp family transcriptional regulator